MFKDKSIYRYLSLLLVIILFTNIFVIGLLGNTRVKAGFWNDHQGGIMMVVKGVIMFWIINLMSKNSSDDNNDSFLTSTIKKGLDAVQNNPDDSDEMNKTQKENITTEMYQEQAKSPNVDIQDISTTEEKGLLDLVNKARKKEGIRPLTINSDLVKIAREKARDMIENNYFDHNSPVYGSPFKMLQDRNIDYLLAGENLASAKTVQSAFSGLMKSIEHKKNIMDNRYDNIGVGIVEDKNGVLTVVQLFTDSPDILK